MMEEVRSETTRATPEVLRQTQKPQSKVPNSNLKDLVSKSNMVIENIKRMENHPRSLMIEDQELSKGFSQVREAGENTVFWDNFWKFKAKQENEKNAPVKQEPMMKVVKRLTDRKAIIRDTVQVLLKEKLDPKISYKVLILALGILVGVVSYRYHSNLVFKRQIRKLLRVCLLVGTSGAIGTIVLLLLLKIRASMKRRRERSIKV